MGAVGVVGVVGVVGAVVSMLCAARKPLLSQLSSHVGSVEQHPWYRCGPCSQPAASRRRRNSSMRKANGGRVLVWMPSKRRMWRGQRERERESAAGMAGDSCILAGQGARPHWAVARNQGLGTARLKLGVYCPGRVGTAGGAPAIGPLRSTAAATLIAA